MFLYLPATRSENLTGQEISLRERCALGRDTTADKASYLETRRLAG